MHLTAKFQSSLHTSCTVHGPSISQCHSKGRLLFYVTGNNSLISSLPKILGSNWLHESLSIDIQCSIAFSIKQFFITFTHNQCMWCLHNHTQCFKKD